MARIDSSSVLSLFRDLEAISGCRDRHVLGRLMIKATARLLGERADVALYRRENSDLALSHSLGPTVMESALTHWPELLGGGHFSEEILTKSRDGRLYGVLPLQSSEVSSFNTLVAFAIDEQHTGDYLETLRCMARVYGNHVSLLDYSELDSLTRLLNRKTFDETFDRLLTSANGENDETDLPERRSEEEGAPWLGVIDIDHFKRVNDSFGHLFGDEVLLRVADLMRKTFRSGDRLFRFGGEEFVVILNAKDEAHAARGFDRFRCAVGSYEFPQVGTVTCSIGLTGVAGFDVPTDVVGRADEALYFAKEHGRNQVLCYETLLAQGAIAQPTAAPAPVDDFDIDALFA